MKTRTIIAFYLLLLLLGLALTGFPQGIVNDGGYITASTSNYVKFSGSGDALMVNGNAGQVTLGNLDVDFTGSGVFALSVTDTSFITVDGTTSLSDTLKLKCNNGTMASLITNGPVSGAYASVEQYIKADQYHMVSSPVTSAKADVYAGCYLLEWDETDSTFSYIVSLTDPLNVAQGYFVWSASAISSPENVNYTGLLNTGDVSVSGLTYTTGSGKGNGWNLVGNPYPSILEWNSSWSKSGIDATIYIYDGTNYKTWNYNLGGYGSMGNGYIPSTQGFWVKANSASPSLTIPNSERTHGVQTFYKGSDNSPENIFTVTVSDKTLSDQLILGFHEDAGDGYSGEYDAYKLFGVDECPQLFAVYGEEQLSVNLVDPPANKDKTIVIGFKTGNEGYFNLAFDNLEMVDPKYGIYLEDVSSGSSNGAWIDVRKSPEYKFYSEPGMFGKRFVLHFNMKTENQNSGNTISNKTGGSVTIYSFGNDVFVNYMEDVTGKMIIYDMMGKELYRNNLEPHKLNKFTPANHTGYYIIKVLTANSVESQKVYIN